MPTALHDINENERFELETLPPDGYVVLRKFSHGEILKRQEISFNQRVNRKDSDYIESQPKFIQLRVYDFKSAIVDHNLEDFEGNTLDLRKFGNVLNIRTDVALEISDLILSYNNIVISEEDEDEDSDLKERSLNL